MKQYSVKYKTISEGKTRGKYRLIINEQTDVHCKQRAKQYLEGITEKDGVKREIIEIIELMTLLNNVPAGIKQTFHD